MFVAVRNRHGWLEGLVLLLPVLGMIIKALLQNPSTNTHNTNRVKGSIKPSVSQQREEVSMRPKQFQFMLWPLQYMALV